MHEGRALDLDAAADRLARILGAAPAGSPHLRTAERAAPPPRAVAVDASSVVLAESGSLLLAAHRAAAVGPGRPALVQPPRIVLLDAREDAAEGVLPTLRTLGELDLALDVVETLDAGDALLLDGALAARPPIVHLDRLLERALARGVDVVGVCKSTSLTIGGAPALAACLLAARASGLTTWSAEVTAPPLVRGRTLIARLSAAEPRAFRFDVHAARDDPGRVLARLAGLAGHPGYPGYPSPLAMAHHAAVITDEHRRALLADVEEACRARGVREDAWRAAFHDYHDVLELGV